MNQSTIWSLTDCPGNLTLAPACFWNHGAVHHISWLQPPPSHPVPSLFILLLSCLCLMGSPCFDSIADVVQSHGGVFMDSSYPSSPVTGPHCRGLRRASEVSIASQVSGMADSYTATNIANSKCSHYHKYLSLSTPLSVNLFSLLSSTPSFLFCPVLSSSSYSTALLQSPLNLFSLAHSNRPYSDCPHHSVHRMPSGSVGTQLCLHSRNNHTVTC